ncbi:putative UDP-glucuronate decarboxylase [Helianthus anomalus]
MELDQGFLLSNTSEVYGDSLVHPQKETYWWHVNPTDTLFNCSYAAFILFYLFLIFKLKCLSYVGVRSCYSQVKRIAENLTMNNQRDTSVEVRIGRIFNTYGPWMCLDDGHIVSNFVSQYTLPQGILHSEPSELRWVSKGVQNVFDFLQNDFQDMDLIGWGSFKIDDLSNTLSNKKHIDKRKWDMQFAIFPIFVS